MQPKSQVFIMLQEVRNARFLQKDEHKITNIPFLKIQGEEVL